MKANAFAVLMAISLLLTCAVLGEQQQAAPVRFEWVNVFIDSKEKPLAAYQFELTAKSGDVKIAGVEGGEHPAFKEPPYYDPAALSNDRIIIAAFNIGKDLPAGRTRVARLHVQVSGVPEYAIKLVVTASADGKEIPATASVSQGEGR